MTTGTGGEGGWGGIKDTFTYTVVWKSVCHASMSPITQMGLLVNTRKHEMLSHSLEHSTGVSSQPLLISSSTPVAYDLGILYEDAASVVRDIRPPPRSWLPAVPSQARPHSLSCTVEHTPVAASLLLLPLRPRVLSSPHLHCGSVFSTCNESFGLRSQTDGRTFSFRILW